MKSSTDGSHDWWERTKQELRRDGATTVQVYVRSLAPSIGSYSRQESIINRLTGLEQEGRLEEVDITVWGDSICLDSSCVETPAGKDLLDRAMEIERWADSVDPDVRTPFEETTVSSSVTGETFRRVTLPQLTVAVYDKSGLAVVLPARIGGQHHAVDEVFDVFDGPASREGSVETTV